MTLFEIEGNFDVATAEAQTKRAGGISSAERRIGAACGDARRAGA